MSDTSEIQHDPNVFFAGCGCAACTGFRPEAEDASADPLAGTTAANGKPIWSADQIAAYLNRTLGGWGDEATRQDTRSGDPNVITFGFHETQQSLFDNGYVYASGGGLFGLSEYFQFAAFNEAQRAATREAIGFWDDVIAVNFQETSAYQGDINFGNLTNSPNTQAYSRIPTPGLQTVLGGQVAGIAGDVWVSASQVSNFQFAYGQYGLNTLTHEIGHSLGLSHPGAYNFGPGFAVTYANGAEYFQDARNYTIMSYWNPRDIGARDYDWNIGTISYGATPMIHDILAVQRMYGVDTTTRTGDTTYGFNSNAGRDAFDFTINKAPVVTLWDAGGIDTLDASGYKTNQVIDLREGALSSIGGITPDQAPTLEQVNANRAAIGYAPISATTWNGNLAALNANPLLGRLTDNVGIAYGAVIENAVGGAGNDTVTGNAANNVLTGNAGSDVLVGADGGDRLLGGDGLDRLLGGDGLDQLWGGAGADTFVFGLEATRQDTKRGLASVDVVWDFDAAQGDKIDLSGLGLVWGGNGSPKAGAVTVQSLGNANAAENVLGFDIPGLEKGDKGKVSLVYADKDGDGEADIVIVLVGVSGVSANDFIFGGG